MIWRALALGLAATLACSPVWAQDASDASDAGDAGDAGAETADASVDGGDIGADVAPVAEPDKPTDPLVVLASGNDAAVAQVIGILPSVMDDATALAEVHVQLEKMRDATQLELTDKERELPWLQKLRERLAAQAEASKPTDDGPVADDGPVSDGDPKAEEDDPETEEKEPPSQGPTGGEDAPIPPVDPVNALLDEMERETKAAIETLTKRLEIQNASLAAVTAKLATLKEEASSPGDARLAEARAARDAVEKEREKTEEATNQAQEQLARVKDEQEKAKGFKADYRLLAELDTQLRSEEIFILARVQEELFRDVENGNKVVTELAADRKAIEAKVADIERRLEAGSKTDVARREAGDLYDDLNRRRESARSRTFYSKKLLDVIDDRLDDVEEELAQVVVTAAASRKAAAAQPDNQLQQKAASVDEARRSRLRAHQLLLDQRRRLYILGLGVTQDEVHFAKRTQILLQPMVPEGKVSEIRALNDANLRGVVDEGLDLFIETLRHASLRRDQVSNLADSALSLAGIWWMLKALLAGVALYLGLKLIRQRREEVVDSLSRRALNVRWLRGRQGPVLKAVQLAGALAGPLSMLAAAHVVFWLFPPDAPVVILLSAIINGGLLYFIAIRTLRTLALPRWYRNTAEGASAGVSDSELAATASQPPELQRAIFFVATVRLLLLYTVICQVALFLVRASLGMFFLGNAIHLLGVLGYVVVIYVLLLRWRETIARMFAAQLSGRSERAVAFVQTHKDKVYGIVVIFVAFLYVVVLEGWRFGKKYVAELDISKKIQNFLFRRRIEYRKAQEEQAKGEADAVESVTLPPDLLDLFAARPLTSEGFLVARPEHQRLRDAAESWKGRRGKGPLNVVGFRGAGKTTSLNQVAPGQGESHHVVRFDIESRITEPTALLEALASDLKLERGDEGWTVDTFTEALLALAPTLILVDNAHRLFLRQVAGFEALDVFERVVTATGHKHQWISAFDGYAWIYLRNTQRKPLTGPSVVHLTKWDDEALRKLVDGRMDQTPLQATFEGLNLDADPGQDRLVNLDQSAGGYFRLLEEATLGNPRVAMDYWLGSLAPTGAADMKVNLFQPMPKKRLVALNDNARFVLVALIQHVELTLDELAHILNFTAPVVAEILTGLDDASIIERCSQTGRATIKTEAYSPVATFLESQNLLHV